MEQYSSEKEHTPGAGRTAADDAAAKKARAEAATWREIAEKAANDYSKREGKFARRLAELKALGALARGCLEAKDAAKALEAAAEKWEVGERDLARQFEKEAKISMIESLDGLDKADDLWEMEQEEKSTSQDGTKTS